MYLTFVGWNIVPKQNLKRLLHQQERPFSHKSAHTPIVVGQVSSSCIKKGSDNITSKTAVNVKLVSCHKLIRKSYRKHLSASLDIEQHGKHC